MSLRPRPDLSVPDNTARVARAIFPEGNLVMQMRDQLLDDDKALFRDDDFADLFPQVGQPAAAPARLALVLILQFMEALTDRQAADAVRTRIDWKYLLGLPLTDGGFHHTVLSEFRTRLLDHGAERRLFEAVLEAALERDLVKARGRQRTDSTHVLAAVHSMTRIEAVTETLRHALNEVASTAPEWLLAHTTSEWADRYGPRASDYRLPKSEAKRRAYVEQVGADGAALLDAIREVGAPAELHGLAAMEILRRVWIQNFKADGGRARWRESGEIPPTALFVGSPYDLDARYAKKRTTRWTGYKVHLTETCDDERPNLITAVATTAASDSDDSVTASIHASLQERGLLPARHIADTGFVNAPLLVEAGEHYGVDLIGPTRGDIGPVLARSGSSRKAPVSRRATSASIGSADRPCARRARLARAGRQPSTVVRTRSSRSNSPQPTAAPVQAAHNARGRRHRGGPSRSDTELSTRRSKLAARGSGQRSSPPSTRVVPA